MSNRLALQEVHIHLADAAAALARALGSSIGEINVLPLARLITEAQEELQRLTKMAPEPCGEMGGAATAIPWTRPLRIK